MPRKWPVFQTAVETGGSRHLVCPDTKTTSNARSGHLERVPSWDFAHCPTTGPQPWARASATIASTTSPNVAPLASSVHRSSTCTPVACRGRNRGARPSLLIERDPSFRHLVEQAREEVRSGRVCSIESVRESLLGPEAQRYGPRVAGFNFRWNTLSRQGDYEIWTAIRSTPMDNRHASLLRRLKLFDGRLSSHG
jgi:hypothetical protein